MLFGSITLFHYLVLASLLFVVGVSGVFMNRKSIIAVLMSIELMLLAVNINMVAFSTALHDLTGQVFSVFILTVAAAEAAIGLAILIVYYRHRGSAAVDSVRELHG
jgi:NADH-quinone oxidoreductase subunit K